MTPPDEARVIAERLTKAQRAMLRRSRQNWSYEPPRCFGPANTRRALRDRGLGHGDYVYLTPLGLRVRAILTEDTSHEA